MASHAALMATQERSLHMNIAQDSAIDLPHVNYIRHVRSALIPSGIVLNESSHHVVRVKNPFSAGKDFIGGKSRFTGSLSDRLTKGGMR